MPATLTSFTPGDLVISIYGNGDASGTYTLDQASAITLYELTTSGTVAGQLVLPETTSVVNGTNEYAISGEYGSASEGTLQLSSDGQSLVTFGYGVNDVAFNTGAATVYGNAALGQSTTIKGGVYTPVSREVADVSYNGTVDTSTSLYNIYNTNNPRTAASVNGTTFYLSGQSVKGSTTQGVFTATDGGPAATAIDTSTDTRSVEIYNGALYVSRDSTQSISAGTNIASYGTTLPNSATQPVPLAGITQSVTLQAGQGNTVNGGAVGTSVNLSPENFFFANATTLYVADSGFPKEGGIGDGGLQKWSYNGSTWVLDYTLSTGLNLVANTATTGTTGLFGLTGAVTGGTVQLYATTSTANELDPSYLYGITDTLAATALPAGETFTQLIAAASDTIIRGVSFAPTASTAAPTAATVSAGTNTSNVTVTSGSTLVVQSGGNVLGATILSAGSATISGTDTNSIIGHGGFESVSGMATGDQIDGVQLVSAATAVVSNETVNNGGVVDLFLKGALANNLVVTTGGTLNISGNATGNNTIINGGVVSLQSPKAVLSGSLTFSGPGTLQAAAVASAGFGDQAVISGFGTGDTVDLTVVGSGATLATSVVSGNTVAVVTSGAVTQSFTFAGSAASSLALGADATSGQQINFVPAPTTNVTVSSGVTSSGLSVTSGSTLTVNGGGTVVSASILSGGNATIGGVDSGSTLALGGNETVSGTANGDQIFGTQLVSASTAVVSNETVFNGGVVDLYLKGAVANAITVSNGGALNISGNATANNTVLTNGATLALQSPKATLSGSLTFSGAATLAVTATTSAGFGDLAVISGFGANDAVDDVTLGAGATLTSAVVSGNTVETVTSGGISESYIFAGTYISGFFALKPDETTGVMITVAGTPCYCPGTLILTGHGEVPVEDLAIGDNVITARGEQRPIRWIGHRAYSGRFAAGQKQILPVRIAAGALGHGLPHRDLTVSPLHAMFIDGVLIPAAALVNGDTIVQLQAVASVEYIHIELDSHDVIIAEGAASETFIDDGSRGMFHNAADYRALYPEAVAAPARYCAPRVEDGAVLEAVRRRLAGPAASPLVAGSIQGQIDQVSRSRVRGWARDPALPDQPVQLRLTADGVVLGQVTADGYRPDLARAGIGHGGHGFDFRVPGGLPAHGLAMIRVERVTDGAALPERRCA